MINENLFLCKAQMMSDTQKSDWIYGYYVYLENEHKHYIITTTIETYCKSSVNNIIATAFEVKSNTVCRCTGIKDINGDLIYEYDICKRFIPDYLPQNGTIYWNNKEGCFVYRFYDVYTKEYNELYMDEWCKLQIAGNEFDDEQ